MEREEGGSLIIGPAGNSFSGPHSGVAALMLSANPELNPWEISEILRKPHRISGQRDRTLSSDTV